MRRRLPASVTHDLCPFCTLPAERILAKGPDVLAVRDGFPVSKGHALVIPRRHVASLFELSRREQQGVWSMVARIRRELEVRLRPHGFNIGVNDGTAAGQTVPHAHVHVIPRWEGDVPDPRGGVRWVIPRKAAYWKGKR